MLTLADPDRAGPRRPARSRRALVPMVFDVHPVEQLERHVRVALYLEDDMETLKDVIVGPRLLFGSDFPHAEGLPEPTER